MSNTRTSHDFLIVHGIGVKKQQHKNKPGFNQITKQFWAGHRNKSVKPTLILPLTYLHKTGCTHLRHMALLSKLCQRKQYWWDAAPHQHWKGLGTLCNKLWRKKTEGHCCEGRGTQGKGELVVSFTPVVISLFTDAPQRRPQRRGAALLA